ncbi:MAG: endolytic transglycosylase MltG, partial [Deltaproteobacteria bacterium]|nr:endolytic transglycosylase MltG [Deltaproteobacteria bacterium]
MKKRLLIISIIICIGALACIGFAADLWFYANKPISANPEKIVVHLKPGQSFAKTTEILEENGLIRSPFRFNLISRFKGYDKKVQAGEYLLSETMTPLHILEKMTRGEVKLYKLTIPEGLNIYQIAELASQGGFAQKAAFIEAATDSAYAREKGIEADTLEGYLFPDTYFFPRGASVKKIIGTMVDRFRTVFNPQWQEQSKRIGLNTVLNRSTMVQNG